jgi:hypothetical protein
MQPAIAIPPKSAKPTGTRAKMNGGENYLDFDDPYALWSMDISFPFFRNGIVGECTFAIRIFDFTRWTFSNYVWLTATA